MSGTISSIALQKRNKKRANIYLDGQYAFSMYAMEAIRLRVGQWLGEDEINALQRQDNQQEALQKALHFIAYRPRSAQEVRTTLAKKAFTESTIEVTLATLEEKGWIDDASFAQYWVNQREQFKPRSKRMMRYELLQKGLEDAIIASALEEIDEESLAYRAALQWTQRPSNLLREDLKEKLGSYLARRGFSYAMVRETVAKMVGELELGLEQ